MKNFLKIGEGINVMGLLLALKQKPYLWNQNLLRTTHANTPHTEVDDIWLRFIDVAAYGDLSDTTENRHTVLDQHESVNYPALAELPEARAMIFNLMATVQGERLGRAMITKLEPGKRIYPHVDSGDHAAYYERFHIVIASAPGCLFHADDETVHMKPGECWWFQNQSRHEVVNNSPSERIHLIVDIHTGRSLV
jgi:quercetin dioxygenase-like cupin family protein